MKIRMVAAKNNPVLLCKKPHQLIKIALKDLRQVEKMPDKYVVDMGFYHRPNSHCSVCFAGAVMAISLKISHKANIIPSCLDNELLRFRLEALDSVRCGNVAGFVLGFYGSWGWEEFAPFDAIMVTAAPEEIPPALLAQLAKGGRMVVPVGRESGVQQLLSITRTGDRYDQEALEAVSFVPLVQDPKER